MIDLRAAIRTWAIDTLPYDRNDHDVVAEINGKDARELLIVFHNWMSRHIFATPRKVQCIRRDLQPGGLGAP